MGGDDDGQGDIAALGKHGGGPDGAQGAPHGGKLFFGIADGPSQSEGNGEVFQGKTADEFRTGDLCIGYFQCGNNIFFDAVRSEIAKVATLLQLLHERNIGHHVSRAAAAREYDFFHMPPSCRPQLRADIFFRYLYRMQFAGKVLSSADFP